MSEINFDAEDYEPRAGFGALPAGTYRVQIVKSEIKRNSKDTGDLLELELEVLEEGKHYGQRAWDRLNINNISARASEMARSKLSLICHCVGYTKVGKTEELHERPLLAKISYRGPRYENGRNFGPSNEVDNYYPDDERGGGGPGVDLGEVEAEAKHMERPQQAGPEKAAASPARSRAKAAEPSRPNSLGTGGAGSADAPWRRPRA